MSKKEEPLTVEDFRKGWEMAVESKNKEPNIPLRKFASFRVNARGGNVACIACNKFYNDGAATFKYSEICLGVEKKVFFFKKKLMCPTQPHYHVQCKICGVIWLESMEWP